MQKNRTNLKIQNNELDEISSKINEEKIKYYKILNFENLKKIDNHTKNALKKQASYILKTLDKNFKESKDNVFVNSGSYFTKAFYFLIILFTILVAIACIGLSLFYLDISFIGSIICFSSLIPIFIISLSLSRKILLNKSLKKLRKNVYIINTLLLNSIINKDLLSRENFNLKMSFFFSKYFLKYNQILFDIDKTFKNYLDIFFREKDFSQNKDFREKEFKKILKKTKFHKLFYRRNETVISKIINFFRKKEKPKKTFIDLNEKTGNEYNNIAFSILDIANPKSAASAYCYSSALILACNEFLKK